MPVPDLADPQVILGAAVDRVDHPEVLRHATGLHEHRQTDAVVRLTSGGRYVDGWRTLPRIYAAGLVVTAVAFYALTRTRLPEHTAGQSLAQRLAPLRNLRVWRFGLYYVAVFGGFVALSQWMIGYYVNVYDMSVSTVGLLTACFSLPAAVTRALGGWLSDRLGARSVMYWVLDASRSAAPC